MTRSLACFVLPLFVSGLLVAQQPGAAPATPVPPAAAKGEKLRLAFVDAGGGRRVAIIAAADEVMQGGAEGRMAFMAVLRAVIAVAPAPTAAAAPAPATSPAGTPGAAPATNPPAAGSPAGAPAAEAKPVEFPDAIKALMAAAVAGPEAETSAALAKIAADKDNGTAALARLAERGRAIHARCLTATLRKRMETNAIFAGQYADLREFAPDAIDVLLGWVKDPPREAAQPDQFRSACVRALRDIVPPDGATDALRNGLKAGIGKAQQARNEDLMLTLICALHQFGEPEAFDQLKAEGEKMAASDKDEEKAGGLNTLANLHYQARQYTEAAAAYTALIAILEKQPQQAQGLPTMIYNAACSLSLAGKLDDAFAMLEKALVAGQKERGLSKAMIDSDHDMNNLRADARFGKLMEQYFGPKKEAPKDAGK